MVGVSDQTGVAYAGQFDMDTFAFPVNGRTNLTLGSGLVPCGKEDFPAYEVRLLR
jgi:hypothetical protein